MSVAIRVATPDEGTLHEAALEAHASHLHLVIDTDGQVKLTPILLPGMWKIAPVADKQWRRAA